MANEQEAAAGLYSLLTAKAGEDGVEIDPSTPGEGDPGVDMNMSLLGGEGDEEAMPDLDRSPEGMRQLTEMLLHNRPVIDPLKNQGFGIVTPHQHDILSGRGNGANQHPGNIFFRNLIARYKHHYIHTGPSEKKLITKKIVEDVQLRTPPGRFLKQNNDTELWDCLDMDKVLKKTGQALREKAPELKKKAKEDYKVRATTSEQSYFQNSKASGGSGGTMDRKMVHSAAAAAAAAAANMVASPADLMSMRFDPNTPFSGDSSSSMNFSLQPGALDALAYQSIPLANPKGHYMDVDDNFDMSHLAEVVTEQVEINPVNKEKMEHLIGLAMSPQNSLNDIYEFLKNNTIALETKTQIRRVTVGGNNDLEGGGGGGGHSKRSTQRIKMEQMSNYASVVAISNPNLAASAHPHDVLFCDGVLVPSHPGSQYFCEQVNLQLPQFTKTGGAVNVGVNGEKPIEQKVIESIGLRWPPGRFLGAADVSCKTWRVLTFEQAVHATNAHLRRASRESDRVVIPSPRDVLVIRGKTHHKGNVYFQSLVEKNAVLNKDRIMVVAKHVMDEVTELGGRFLKFNAKYSFWEPLDFSTVLKITAQKLLDLAQKRKTTLLLKKKAMKTVDVVVPALDCITENVMNGDRDCDPPGLFHNYYTNEDYSLVGAPDSSSTKDPPGQIAKLVALQKTDVKQADENIENNAGTFVPMMPDVHIPNDAPDDYGYLNGNQGGTMINEKRKRDDDIPYDAKRMKLEP